ncbi:MAG: ABC transporter permease [Saprospiraceae bacterium]|nr:ABC transporter permease [Saprospiraceae bacterium]
MTQFKAFIKKEFYHIMRDRKTLLVLIGMPIVQIILFGFALTNEVKNTVLCVADLAKDDMSQALVAEVNASKYFDVKYTIDNVEEADRMLRSGKARMVLVIPKGISYDLRHGHVATLQLITDGTNPNMATTINTYLTSIVRDFRTHHFGKLELPMTIVTIPRMLYNPQLKGEYTFVPGVIAMVLMIICVLMTSVSIVKEKELGNMEMLLVSPTHPLVVILSKAVPYFILSLLLVTIILLMSRFVLHIPIRGNIFLLYGVSGLFIIAALALGLVISTFTNSQQVAMLISLMGMMLPTIMFGGFMFPIENMPLPMQVISNIVPAKWFYYAINDIMIKGLGIEAVLREILILAGFAILFIFISLRKFNLRLA